MAEELFLFVQLEFPWVLGPPDGRYLLRALESREPQHVLVLDTLGARRAQAGARARAGRRRLPFARSRALGATVAPEPAPAPVATTRTTIVDPVSVAAERQAQAWLDELDAGRQVDGAVAVVNRALHAHRIAAADPHVHEVTPAQALVIRAGWGEGEQVAYGRWLHARELRSSETAAGEGAGRPAGRRRAGRSAALRTEERLAWLLGARAAMLVCEEFVLRARLDLQQGRLSHAAVELERAFALALPELHAEGRHDLALRLAELEQLRAGVEAQAQAAIAVGAASPQEDVVRNALERLEATLRARTAAGLG